MTRVVFLDIETTGLDSDRHEITEIAAQACNVEQGKQVERLGDPEVWWIEPVHLQTADSTALRLNHFYRRRAERDAFTQILDLSDLGRRLDGAAGLAKYLDGAHLAGCQPGFDAEFVEAWLRQYCAAPSWHYRKIDVESMAMGFLGWDEPPGLDRLLKHFGMYQPHERHTAAYDVECTIKIFEKVWRITS